MIKVIVSLICCLLMRLSVTAASVDGSRTEVSSGGEVLAKEQKHFLECLAYVYSPGLWFSYNDALYFTTMTEAQARQLESMRQARSGYVALTNREKWHEMAAKALVASGVDAQWRNKLLLEFSSSNQNLTPTLSKPVRILPRYTVLQKLGNGDVLIQEPEGAVYFVMNFGRGADDQVCTNGLFIREGEKTYTTQAGGQNTVEAYSSVGLNAAERAVLERVSAEFRREAILQKPAVIPAGEREEFELLKARASDSNPYMQYLVGMAYLQGKGTPRDESLAMEWLRRAGANGSGDAKSFLNQKMTDKPK